MFNLCALAYDLLIIIHIELSFILDRFFLSLFLILGVRIKFSIDSVAKCFNFRRNVQMKTLIFKTTSPSNSVLTAFSKCLLRGDGFTLTIAMQ